MRTIYIALAEIRIYFQDRGDLAFSLLLPIAIFALMYGAFGGQSTFSGTARIVNQDGGKYATKLINDIEKADGLDVELLSAAEATEKLKNSDLQMVVFIPADFSEKLAAGKPAELVFKQRGNGGQENQIIAGLIRGEAEQMNGDFQVLSQVKKNLKGQGFAKTHIKKVTERFIAREHKSPLIGIKEESLGGTPNPVKAFLPGIITMFVLFAVTLNARSIVEERKRGTLERLLTTKLSVGQLFTGKWLAGVSRGFSQTLILLALSYAVFRSFTPSTFLGAAIVCLLFVAAASSISLIIAGVSRTEDQTIWMATLFTIATAMFGGTFFEVPKGSSFESLSRLSINTYVNDSLKTIMGSQGSLFDVWQNLAVLAGVAIVALILSRLAFKALPGGK